MPPSSAIRVFVRIAIASTLPLIACRRAEPSPESDQDQSSRGDAEGSSRPGAKSDRCQLCASADDCSTGFCNRVALDEVLGSIRGETPSRGRCSEPQDTETCNCISGVLSGSKLCVGIGCPRGDYVMLCDHLSGEAYDPSVTKPQTGSSQSGSGAGGGSGGGGTFASFDAGAFGAALGSLQDSGLLVPGAGGLTFNPAAVCMTLPTLCQDGSLSLSGLIGGPGGLSGAFGGGAAGMAARDGGL